MADVFLSYAREDQERVADLVHALVDRGWTVWWDRQIPPGARYEDVIERELQSARCVVVVLTEAALTSTYVRSEAAEARDRGILLPVLLDDVRVPMSMNQTQCADLRRWPGDHGGMTSLLESMAELIDGATPTGQSELIGRDAELGALKKVFRRAERHQGGLVLLNGEPGIGKTALTEQFTRQLPMGSALVAIGQCYDERGAPSYAPWVQILNQVLAEVPPPETLLSDADLLLAAMTGLDLEYEVSPAALPDRSALPVGAEYVADVRHRMFEAVTAYLIGAAESRTLVIVMEDVHWADPATLRLLEFLTRRIGDAALLVVATYRDVEVRRDHPLFDSLARLNRQSNVQRMRLAGLTEDGVASLLAERLPISLPPGLASTVFQHTEGNPFFVSELTQVVAAELGCRPDGPIEVHIPEGVRETIGHRLNGLSERCNRVLSLAAVLGLEFSQAELTGLSQDLGVADVLECLEEAETAGIVRAHQRLGQYRFAHALIQETLYDEIPLTRKVVLHRNVAALLEDLYAAQPERALTRIAQHAYRSAQAGDIDKAVDYAVRSARHAENALAHEEALRFYRMALDCLEMDPGDHRAELARIYFAMGRSGENAGLLHLERKYADYARIATNLAREVGDNELFAGAACDYAKASYFSAAASELDEALALDDISDSVRTQCLCFRAIAAKHQGKRDEAERFARKALDFAGQTDDAQIALAWTQLALTGRPEKLSERLRIGQEAAAMADAAGDLLSGLQAYRWLIMGCLEQGDLGRAREALVQHRDCAERLRSAHWLGISVVGEACMAMLEGRWSEAEVLIEDGERRGLGVYEDGASGTYAVQMHLLQRETGRLEKHAPLLIPHIRERLADPRDAQLWNLPGVCVEVGLCDEARQVLREVMRNDLSVVPRDDLFAVHVANVADACVALEEREFAQPLYSVLLPYAGQMIVHELAMSQGPSDLYLGSLAALMNRRQEAADHFERALELVRRAGTPPWHAHVLHRYGLLMARSAERGDRERGAEMLKSAQQIADRLGMVPLARQCAELLAGGADVLPDNLTPRELELLKLIAAGRSNKDISRVLDISLNTVATHVRSILVKTHCANRTEAAAYALQRNLV